MPACTIGATAVWLQGRKSLLSESEARCHRSENGERHNQQGHGRHAENALSHVSLFAFIVAGCRNITNANTVQTQPHHSFSYGLVRRWFAASAMRLCNLANGERCIVLRKFLDPPKISTELVHRYSEIVPYYVNRDDSLHRTIL